ncbi:MAG TPA: PQQ-binding-like beta-propeller repeat protein [Mucilaginibacter sp.]|nr:PQQ-binding-like beta-propeller repeat protein [Mucilaginibacter sp.]
MVKKFVLPLLILAVFAGCKKKEPNNNNNNQGNQGKPAAPNTQHISVLTQHNDNTRAGLNDKENVLNTSNVNSKQFGKLFVLTVDDQVYAQPLVVGNLSIGSGTHNVVFIATVNNTVYAYDGDSGKLYWKQSYTQSGMRAPTSHDMASSWCNPYTDFTYDIGIVGTPVIDSAAQTMYFVARSTDGTNYLQYLHAINITNGSEQAGSPVNITASMPGTGDGAVNGVVSFDARRNNQRQGLTLVNGTVYISYSSHCDWNPYHGWILGYDAKSLQQKIVYNDTPNGENGGLWESGMGMAADDQGNLYVTSGNGTVGQGNQYQSSGNGTIDNGVNPDPTDPTDRGESAMKLSPSGSTLQLASYFTPTNYLDLNNNDLDYGVMGTLLIPNSNFYLTGCKDGNMYLVNKDNMGGYSSSGNLVQQTIPLNNSMHCQPAYYKGSSGEYVYVWSENDRLRALSFDRSSNTFSSNQVIASASGPTGGCGATLSVSSSGANSGTGILWAWYASSGDAGGSPSPGILRAFDANDITKELWNSNQTAGDSPGNYSKFCSPTIADGKVYLATFSGKVVVYGLK